MKISRIWFEGDYIYVSTAEGNVLRQPLRFYPRLRHATDAQREDYHLSTVGIHWRNIDEDISFESFLYDKHEPVLMYMG